jgi:hypothetical protein
MSLPEQYDGWFQFPPQCDDRAEIGIGGEYNAVLSLGLFEYLFVACGLKTEIPDVHGIVTTISKVLSNDRR